jgi:xylulokinase
LAAERALERLGSNRPGIGYSGQMHGLVCLDERDRVIRPAILWNDQRTAAECEEIEERVGRERLIQLTGNRALTGFTAPKLLWLRRHEPEAYARIRRILLPKDYVRLRLTGEHAIDVADASGTLLFDVANRRWSDEVLDALELPGEWLPPVYESTEIAGAGDQQAAALGVGIDRPGPVSVVLGTSGVVFAVLPEYAAEPEGRVHVFCHAVPGAWEAMGVMLSAAGSLRWFRDALAPGVSYSDLVAEAETAPAGSDGLTFLPYLQGERTPHADPSARAMFEGLSLRHDRGGLVRSVLEGVAYGLRDSLELLRSLGVAADGGPGLRRRRTQPPVAPNRRVGARAAAAADRGRGGVGLRRGSPGRRSGRRLRGRPRCRRRLRARARDRRARPRMAGRVRDGYRRFGRCTRLCGRLDDSRETGIACRDARVPDSVRIARPVTIGASGDETKVTRDELEIEIPDGNLLGAVYPDEPEPVGDATAAAREALESPVSGPRFSELLAARRRSR